MPEGELTISDAPITLVVPCYNEAQRLDVEAFAKYAVANREVSFLFADDGSTDDTAVVIGQLLADNPDQFRLEQLPVNRGKAAAVRAGILAALERSPAVVGFWDADLATPLEELEGMRQILIERPGVHVVTGARVNLLGRSIRRNLVRHWVGRIFATMASGVLRLPVYDTQCGAKLFRVRPWTAELFAEPFRTSWVFDVEILARMASEPLRSVAGDPRSIIYEHPLTAWFDVEGSKFKLRHAFGAAADLAKIAWRYRTGRH